MINSLQRNVSRNDIECPGDILPYNCSIISNSETVHLIWRVTAPGLEPINVTYDHTSGKDESHSLNTFINTTLTNFVADEYIESILYVTVVADLPINQTKLECLMERLGNDTIYVPVNISGILLCPIFNLMVNIHISASSSNWLQLHK